PSPRAVQTTLVRVDSHRLAREARRVKAAARAATKAAWVRKAARQAKALTRKAARQAKALTRKAARQVRAARGARATQTRAAAPVQDPWASQTKAAAPRPTKSIIANTRSTAPRLLTRP